MAGLKHLLKKVQAVPGGTTKDAICEMYEILEWFYEMIKDEDSFDVSTLDNYKVEIHGRFRHLLNSLAALEARLCKVEAALGIVIKPWVPLEGESKPKDMSDSLRTHARNRLTRKLLSQKEKELYELAFLLYREKRFGREYLRQLVTIACIDVDAEQKT